MASYDPGKLSDAQARVLVIKALRQTSAALRKADSAGERVERELDRLVTRKTRINASSLVNLGVLYQQYDGLASAVAKPLSDAVNVASQF